MHRHRPLLGASICLGAGGGTIYYLVVSTVYVQRVVTCSIAVVGECIVQQLTMTVPLLTIGLFYGEGKQLGIVLLVALVQIAWVSVLPPTRTTL